MTPWIAACQASLSITKLSFIYISSLQPHPLGAPIPCVSEILWPNQNWEGEVILSAAFAKLDYMNLVLQRAIFPGCMKKLCREKEITYQGRRAQKSNRSEPRGHMKPWIQLSQFHTVLPSCVWVNFLICLSWFKFGNCNFVNGGKLRQAWIIRNWVGNSRGTVIWKTSAQQAAGQSTEGCFYWQGVQRGGWPTTIQAVSSLPWGWREILGRYLLVRR